MRRLGCGFWGVAGLFAVFLAGCRPDLPPPRETDVLDALVDSVVARMGEVVVVSRPSDCRGTKVSLPPAAWAAFEAANANDAGALDLDRYAAKLQLDTGEADAEAIRARRGMPVVSLSRVGMAGDQALLCVEVFGAGDRGYYLLLHRDGRGSWTLKSEVAAWEDAAESWELPPEELPDGVLYED